METVVSNDLQDLFHFSKNSISNCVFANFKLSNSGCLANVYSNLEQKEKQEMYQLVYFWGLKLVLSFRLLP